MISYPFVGRIDQISQIKTWLKKPNKYLFINYHGIGGIGKTSLMLQIANLAPSSSVIIDLRQPEMRHRLLVLETIARKILPTDLLEQFTAIKSDVDQIDFTKLDEIIKTYDTPLAQTIVDKRATIHGDLKTEVKIEATVEAQQGQHEKHVADLTERLVTLIAEACKRRHILILFDHFEHLERALFEEANLMQDWILNSFLGHNSVLKDVSFGIIIFGRTIINVSTDHLEPETEALKNLSFEETQEYLKKSGIQDLDAQDVISRLTSGNPFCLFQAVTLFRNKPLKKEDIDPTLLSAEVEEWLVARFLTAKIIESETDEDIKEALENGVIYRFVNSSSLAHLLSWPLPKARRTISKLAKRSLLQKVSSNGICVFHDVLRSLGIAYLKEQVSSRDYEKLHRLAIQYYDELKQSSNLTNEEYLMSLVEPFYHRLAYSEEEAWNYFESEYKPKLDRREMEICSIMASQVNLNKITNPRIEAWFRFRLGDYWRESGEYERAITIYKSVLDDFIEGQKIRDTKLKASIYNNIGWVYIFHESEKNRDKAIQASEIARTLANKNQLFPIEAMALNNLGISWSYKPKSKQKAIDFYHQSLLITESKEYNKNPGMNLVAGMSHENLARIFVDADDLEAAKAECNQASNCYRSANALHWINRIRKLYGRILIEEHRYEEAYKYYRLTWDYWKNTREFSRQVNVLFFLGICHETFNQIDSLSEAHASVCITSLLDSFELHNYWVTEMITAVSRYLAVRRTKENAIRYLKNIIKIWSSSPPFSEISEFEDFLNKQIDFISQGQYFTLSGTQKYHLLSCRVKNRVHWNRVIFISKDADDFVTASLIPCKLCLPIEA